MYVRPIILKPRTVNKTLCALNGSAHVASQNGTVALNGSIASQIKISSHSASIKSPNVVQPYITNATGTLLLSATVSLFHTMHAGHRHRRHSSSSSIEGERREKKRDRDKDEASQRKRDREREGSDEKEEPSGEEPVKVSSSGDTISLGIEETK